MFAIFSTVTRGKRLGEAVTWVVVPCCTTVTTPSTGGGGGGVGDLGGGEKWQVSLSLHAGVKQLGGGRTCFRLSCFDSHGQGDVVLVILIHLRGGGSTVGSIFLKSLDIKCVLFLFRKKFRKSLRRYL